jgi:hypothetical protein
MPYRKNMPKDMREPIWNISQFTIKDFARASKMDVDLVYNLCSKESIAADEIPLVKKLIAAISQLKEHALRDTYEGEKKFCDVCKQSMPARRRRYCSNQCQKKAWNLKLKILRGLDPEYGRSGKGRTRNGRE